MLLRERFIASNIYNRKEGQWCRNPVYASSETRITGVSRGTWWGGGVGRRSALPRLQGGVITEWKQLQGDGVLKLPGPGMQPTAPQEAEGGAAI